MGTLTALTAVPGVRKAWIRPLEPEKFPENARLKLREMCDGLPGCKG